MSIKKKLFLLAVFSLAATTITGFLLFHSSKGVKKEIEEQKILSQIRNKIFERALLRDEYFLYREARPIVQIQAVSKTIVKLLLQESKIVQSADDQVLIIRLGDNIKFLDQTFLQIVASSKNPESSPSASMRELEQRLISQLFVKSQENFAISSQLSEASHRRIIDSQDRTTVFVLLFYTGSMITILVMVFIIWFSVINPLTRLKEAALSIAALDFYTTTTTGKTSNDEIGLLASAFNRMAVKLKESYATLEKKVSDRTQNIKRAETAALNVLEDLQDEKKIIAEANAKVEMLAKDLEKYKLAVDNVSDNIIITDVEGVAIYANKAVEKITGYTPEEAIGKKSGVLWKVPMPQEFYQKMWDTIKIQKKVFISEIQNKRKNGEIYTAVISISPVMNKKGEIEFFVAIERDVTKEKAVDKAKTEFVSLASHQLRTPLTSINWYVEMLQGGDTGVLSDKQQEFLSEVYKASRRMVELVNDLLNISRLETGRLKIKPVPTNLVAFIQDVLKEVEPLVQKNGCQVSLALPDSIGMIDVDPELLREVVVNLLTNAILYSSKDKKGVVIVSFDVKPETYTIQIKDNGIGIPKNAQEHLFEKFFRADNARSITAHGTGLGLYLTKQIVEASGCTIWFSSEPGRGCTFYVTIPVSGMKSKKGEKGLENDKNFDS